MGTGYKWGLISLAVVQTAPIAKEHEYVFFINSIQRKIADLYILAKGMNYGLYFSICFSQKCFNF